MTSHTKVLFYKSPSTPIGWVNVFTTNESLCLTHLLSAFSHECTQRPGVTRTLIPQGGWVLCFQSCHDPLPKLCVLRLSWGCDHALLSLGTEIGKTVKVKCSIQESCSSWTRPCGRDGWPVGEWAWLDSHEMGDAFRAMIPPPHPTQLPLLMEDITCLKAHK